MTKCETPCGDCDTDDGCFYTTSQPVAWRIKRQLEGGFEYYEYYETEVPNAEPLYKGKQ